MGKKNEKKTISKQNWVSSFNLVGKPKINDYTFKIDETSEKSGWIYNALNLGVDCGEKYGTVYCEMMGGYSSTRPNTIYAHGKNDDGTDNFDQRIEVDWDDRNSDIIDSIGDNCFIRVGLERTDKGNNYVKKFLSAYDAIAYIKECLTEDMVVSVRGTLKYSMYNDNVQVRKNVTSITLSKAEPQNFSATFKQSILLDQDSANVKNVDKTTGIMYITARVLDYVKEYNDIEVKGQFPFTKTFEHDIKKYNEMQFKAVMSKFLKVKKNITQINFNGILIEGGVVVPMTIDDLEEDIRFMVEMNMMSLDDAIRQCSSNGKRELRMVLTTPDVRKVGDDNHNEVQIFENRYTEDDLRLDYLYKSDDDMDDNVESNPAPVTSEADGDLDFLNYL